MFAEDVVLAAVELADRAGAARFEIGNTDGDGVPDSEVRWWVTAFYRGARIMTDHHRSPSTAALAFAERMLKGARCKCGRDVTLWDRQEGCRWRLSGQRWEPGCAAPSMPVDGARGDVAAMQIAMNRGQRRAAQRAARRGR